MIRLTLDELRQIVLETSVAYNAALYGASVQEAEIARNGALVKVLRKLHLTTWAEVLVRQTQIIAGD